MSAEAQAAHAFDYEAQEHMRVLDAGLETVKNALSALELPKRDLDAMMQSYKAIFSPFRRFPAEILSEVFIHCLPAVGDVPSMMCAPLLVMSVCKRWHAVALSTPQLWSSLGFRHDASNATVPYGSVPTIAEKWFERAGGLPLSLAVPSDVYFHDHLFDLVAAHAPRWERLSISINITLNLPAPGSFSRLQNLQLQARADPSELANELFTAFQDAPRLRSLSYTGWIREENLVLPWGQLLDLTLRDRPVQACVTALLRASNVETCTLISINSSGTGPQSPAVQHMHLTSLDIRESFAQRRGFLEQTSVTFPALHTLKYSSLRFPSHTFGDFQRRSGFQLQKLWLDDILEISKAEFITCFRSLPTLVHLEFTTQSGCPSCDNFTSEQVLSHLSCRHDPDVPPLLPSLRVLSLHNLSFYDERVAPRLARMIRSRPRIQLGVGGPMEGVEANDSGVACLEKVTVDSRFEQIVGIGPHYANAEGAVIRAFQDLKDEGFDISIVTGTMSQPVHRLV